MYADDVCVCVRVWVWCVHVVERVVCVCVRESENVCEVHVREIRYNVFVRE